MAFSIFSRCDKIYRGRSPVFSSRRFHRTWHARTRAVSIELKAVPAPYTVEPAAVYREAIHGESAYFHAPTMPRIPPVMRLEPTTVLVNTFSTVVFLIAGARFLCLSLVPATESPDPDRSPFYSTRMG